MISTLNWLQFRYHSSSLYLALWEIATSDWLLCSLVIEPWTLWSADVM